MVYMAECTLATVESMALLKRKSKSEFNRQKQLAKFAVSSCFIHGGHNAIFKQKCIRVEEIYKRFQKTHKLTMPWEEDDDGGN